MNLQDHANSLEKLIDRLDELAAEYRGKWCVQDEDRRVVFRRGSQIIRAQMNLWTLRPMVLEGAELPGSLEEYEWVVTSSPALLPNVLGRNVKVIRVSPFFRKESKALRELHERLTTFAAMQ